MDYGSRKKKLKRKKNGNVASGKRDILMCEK